MARIFDVVEYPNEMAEEIVHRFPEEGYGDFRLGSQVIVREAQAAVFFRDGNALDVFKAGRHTIATANIPMLIDFIGKAFNDRTPFPAEVYFVSMREFADHKWGTPQPIIVRKAESGYEIIAGERRWRAAQDDRRASAGSTVLRAFHPHRHTMIQTGCQFSDASVSRSPTR